MLFAACMFAIIFFLPIYLQLGHHVSPQVSGLLLLPGHRRPGHRRR